MMGFVCLIIILIIVSTIIAVFPPLLLAAGILAWLWWDHLNTYSVNS